MHLPPFDAPPMPANRISATKYRLILNKYLYHAQLEIIVL